VARTSAARRSTVERRMARGSAHVPRDPHAPRSPRHPPPVPDTADFASFQGSPDFVLSLARGLKVIESFETNTAGVSVADVSRHTGLSRAAVRRLLMTLEMLGYAESDGGIYRLKPRILRLGYSYFSSVPSPPSPSPSCAASARPCVKPSPCVCWKVRRWPISSIADRPA